MRAVGVERLNISPFQRKVERGTGREKSSRAPSLIVTIKPQAHVYERRRGSWFEILHSCAMRIRQDNGEATCISLSFEHAFERGWDVDFHPVIMNRVQVFENCCSCVPCGPVRPCSARHARTVHKARRYAESSKQTGVLCTRHVGTPRAANSELGGGGGVCKAKRNRTLTTLAMCGSK